MQARAALGATVLDTENPTWFKDIDTEILNIRSGFDCVLGQLYGLYSDALQQDFLVQKTLGWLYTHGFTYCTFDGRLSESELLELNEAWVAEIAARRKA
jgi:hypothetical protein